MTEHDRGRRSEEALRLLAALNTGDREARHALAVDPLTGLYVVWTVRRGPDGTEIDEVASSDDAFVAVTMAYEAWRASR